MKGWCSNCKNIHSPPMCPPPPPSWTEEEIREAVIAQLRDWIAIPDESSRGIFADHVLSRLATLREKNQ